MRCMDHLNAVIQNIGFCKHNSQRISACNDYFGTFGGKVIRKYISIFLKVRDGRNFINEKISSTVFIEWLHYAADF